MKIKTIKCLTFNELNEEQRAQVIENYQDINTDHDWSQWTINDWKEKLERQGFSSPKIYFSGFWSQGDGASFKCEAIDLEKFLKGRRAASKYKKDVKAYQDGEVSASISTSGHYSHEYSMSLDSYDLSEELEAFILEEAREQARKIYSDLKKEYEYLTSDESIAETLEANEYYFNSETLKIESV